ncbi:inner nuclear membrane protein Man1 isoform X2 [Contarinia nasturtii]|uniref:inner nuclear membrane protein Man1 isoform X2 n=1 Tax=Contarinia nasturtii TaxID=265458 RepID=UPI0012D45258|nr:inner nuclear membrane protein Man1 isoform X2 [Contarinia nasturtii]
MEDLNELNNEELQYRLAQFGVPTIPVTTTTRKTLIKRLRNLIESEKSKLRRDTEYATRYSSDEDISSTVNDTKAKSAKGRSRSTISTNNRLANRANLNLPPPTTQKPPTNLWSEKNQTTKKSPTSSIYISPLIQHDTDEESDQNDGMNTSLLNRYKNNSTGMRTMSTVYNGHSSRYSNDTADNSSHSTGILNASSESSTNGNRFDGYIRPPLLSFPSARVSRYLNEPISSRLSMLPRDNSIAYQANIDNTNRKPFSIRNIYSDFFNRQYERYSVKQSFVPCILLSALFFFFTSVIIAYLTMNPDLSLALDAKAATFKLCSDTEMTMVNGEPHFKPTENCIEKDQLEPAFNLLKVLIPQLQKRIEYNRCTDPTAPFAMSAKEVVQFIFETTHEQSAIDIIRALHNAEYLISVNPQWRVGHFIDASAQPSTSISMTNLVRLRQSQANYFSIVKPRLPLSCFLYNKLQAVFAIIGWIVIIALVTFVILFIVRFIRGHLQTRRERITSMIEEIKNVLMEKAYDPDTACTDAASVVINHLRDKLIPPTERNKMESIWNAAIKAVESDSRVQFSVATRNGEDYRVMRWIDTVSPMSQNQHTFGSNTLSASTSSNSSNLSNATSSNTIPCATYPSLRSCNTLNHGNIKKWQSPAFDKSNKIKDPPTECLKIRQMFDKHESSNPNLKQVIQDAILEKVAHTTCKIYDLQLDKQTCCVYVRCASSKDAGMIHDEVNGWWFDSRLVSIKFLRLERYLIRFPNAASGPSYLKPSNTKNLSMTNGDGEPNHLNGKRGADNLTDYEDDDDGDAPVEGDAYFNGQRR